MTRAYIILRDDNKTVCKLYKTADGYPSEMQSIIKELKNTEFLSMEELLAKLLDFGCILLPTATISTDLDFWDYTYQIGNMSIKMICKHRPRLNFNGSAQHFLSLGYKDTEWVEGQPCDDGEN